MAQPLGYLAESLLELTRVGGAVVGIDRRRLGEELRQRLGHIWAEYFSDALRGGVDVRARGRGGRSGEELRGHVSGSPGRVVLGEGSAVEH
jgi:Ribonuclease G/E